MELLPLTPGDCAPLGTPPERCSLIPGVGGGLASGGCAVVGAGAATGADEFAVGQHCGVGVQQLVTGSQYDAIR